MGNEQSIPQAVRNWDERARCVEDLDSNQKPIAERLIDRMAIERPNSDAEEIVASAVLAACDLAPTAKAAAEKILEMRSGPTYCYLAFYGRDGLGQYLKVGMTSHPEKRLYGIATGNPLDCLWAYTARFNTRKRAYGAEQTLLRTLSDHKRRGEWIEVFTDAEIAKAMARQLGEIINGDFQPLGYRDGREAA